MFIHFSMCLTANLNKLLKVRIKHFKLKLQITKKSATNAREVLKHRLCKKFQVLQEVINLANEKRTARSLK